MADKAVGDETASAFVTRQCPLSMAGECQTPGECLASMTLAEGIQGVRRKEEDKGARFNLRDSSDRERESQSEGRDCSQEFKKKHKRNSRE